MIRLRHRSGSLLYYDLYVLLLLPYISYDTLDLFSEHNIHRRLREIFPQRLRRRFSQLTGSDLTNIPDTWPTFLRQIMTRHLEISFSAVLWFLVMPILSVPVPFDFGAWIKGELEPKAGTDIASEINCYNLPYGGLGFISHILTYWAVGWTIWGRKPLWPMAKLTAGPWDILMGSLSILGTIIPAAFAISACRNRWQFVLLAVWKLTLALCATATSLLQAIAIREDREPRGPHESAWTLAIYGAGTIIGMTGLFSLIAESFDEGDNTGLIIVTGVFAIVCGIPASFFILWLFGVPIFNCCCKKSYEKFGIWTVTTTVGLFALLAAFWGDWALAVMVGNLLGSPSDDTKTLYWVYFVSKRLLLLFF
jgi:hypothetical protein